MTGNGHDRSAPNLAQVMQAHPGVPPLEVQMQQECERQIHEALKKFGCQILFREVRINGQVVEGGFAVVKRQGPPA